MRDTLSLDREADLVVAEMMALGAQFSLSVGPVATTWFYRAVPGMRADINRYKAGIDLDRAGFNSAMVGAIRRLGVDT